MINIEIYSPQKLVYKGVVSSVILPGEEGDFEILPGHFSYMATLRIGPLITFKDDKEDQLISINYGTAEVRKDSITVLSKSSEKKEDIDIERAKVAKERAEERIKKAKDGEFNIDIKRAEIALMRALNRLSLTGENFN